MAPHNCDRPSGDRFNGTYVPVGEPSTASRPEPGALGSQSGRTPAGTLRQRHRIVAQGSQKRDDIGPVLRIMNTAHLHCYTGNGPRRVRDVVVELRIGPGP